MAESLQAVEVVRRGDKIIVPDHMPLKEARMWLERQELAEQKEVAIYEQFHCYPLDGALAFWKACQMVCGFASMQNTETFFGPKPPTMVQIPVGVGKTETVPWGRMSVPGVDGYLETQTGGEKPVFVLGGTTRQKSIPKIQQIVAEMKRILAKESIYRGQSVTVNFSFIRDERPFNILADAPQFIDVRGASPDSVIFNSAVKRRIYDNLWTPIQKHEACKARGIPTKRGVLLVGRYGVGKSLTSRVTANIANQAGWTFILLEDVRDLSHALRLARQYQPAVVFAEDVDRATSGERSVSLDEILNTIDGVESKNDQVITVLTTNHVDKINKAMMRPGRMDAVIEMTPPDAAAAIQLITMYGRGLIQANEDLTAAGEALKGQIPAVIRECVERAKLAALTRQTNPANTIVAGEIETKDLVAAAEDLRYHLELMEPDKVDNRDPFEKLGDSLGVHIADALAESVQAITDADAEARHERMEEEEVDA